MKQAVIYTRVSSREQVENYSISAQLTACTDYCNRAGYEVARVFVEEGETAKTADRTEFQKLLSFCEQSKGRVHALVVYKLDRFARDRFDHHAVLARLRRIGIVVRSVTEPVDETPAGELMDAVLAGIYQFDNRVRGERSMIGMKSALRQGRWGGWRRSAISRAATAGSSPTRRRRRSSAGDSNNSPRATSPKRRSAGK